MDKLPDAPHLKRAFLAWDAPGDHSNHVIPVLQRFFHSSSVQLRDIAITACGLRRMDPGEIYVIRIVLTGQQFFKIRALQAIGESGLSRHRVSFCPPA
ncbi:hypothetical protein P4S72_03590 [Vibrio sp. PP-XX7]